MGDQEKEHLAKVVGPYTRVGRVAGRENYARASTIFKRSG